MPNFDQMLVRAGIRMLLVMSEINQLEGWEDSPEKRAAEIIVEYVERGRGQPVRAGVHRWASHARSGVAEDNQRRTPRSP